MLWKWKIQLDKSIIQYRIAENNKVKHVVLIDQNSVNKSFSIIFYLNRYAQLDLELLVLNTDADIKITCVLEGEGAHASVRGAYSLAQSHKVNIETMLHHQAPHSTTKLLMKGVLYESAQSHYTGTIRIEQNASGVNASQENKNIVLSDNARAVSIPNLEVLNNEVKCFHGSAVGRFDDEQLFYAASRGIDEKRAQKILLAAFFADLFDGCFAKRLLSQLKMY